MPRSACCLLCTGFLLGLLSDPEDGGDMFLQKMADFHQTTKILYPRRQTPSSKNFSSTRTDGQQVGNLVTICLQI
jgi:hypothetical protein